MEAADGEGTAGDDETTAHETTEAAFAILGDELRLSILRALARAAEDGERALSFSALYERTDAPNTPQFAYHLRQLEGLFVRRHDDAYALTGPGEQVVRAVLAGTYDTRVDFEPVTVEGACPVCGPATLEATYEPPLVTVACTDCDASVVSYDLPPGAAAGSPREVLHACDRRVRHEYAAALDGVCPTCGGRMDATVEVVNEDLPDPRYAVSRCRQCERQVFAPLSMGLLYHPAAVSAHWRRGVDVTDRPLWAVHGLLDDWTLRTPDEEGDVEERAGEEGDVEERAGEEGNVEEGAGEENDGEWVGDSASEDDSDEPPLLVGTLPADGDAPAVTLAVDRDLSVRAVRRSAD